MQQLVNLWSKLDMRRRAMVVGATFAVFAAVLGLSKIAAHQDMSLLYSGLDGAQAGEVIQALDQQGAAYEVRANAIFVESDMRDRLRMTLAGQGLPANSGSGYELLDSLSGFGTTSQMFDAAYWRAKEGELARTILTSPTVRSARVHIANSSATPFRRSLKPTASVSVTTRNGPLNAANARSFRYLISSAVAGLSPDDVAVIDATTGEVIASDSDQSVQAGNMDRAESLKANVERLLEARVGPGNAIVEVSVETVTESESIHERRFDPQSRVAISTDVEEVSKSEKNNGGAPVTVASNVPDGAANANPRESQSQNSETRERTNFEVSETTREVTRLPGAIKRLSVAVLVNGLPASNDSSVPMEPRSDAELASLRGLVASTVGFDESRGDVITIESLEFDPIPVLGTEARASWLDGLAMQPIRLLQLAVLSLVALVLGLFVVRPILTGSGGARELDAPDSARGGVDAKMIESADVTESIVESHPVTRSDGATSPSLPAIADQNIKIAESSLSARAVDEPGSVGHLKRLIEDRQPDTIEILRSWLEDDTIEETA